MPEFCGRCKTHINRFGNNHAESCPIIKQRKQLLDNKNKPKLEKEIQTDSRTELVFLRESKYAGKCSDMDCNNTREVGDSIYWNPKTREVFCEDCKDEYSAERDIVNKKQCAAVNCKVFIKDELTFCYPHFRLLSKELRDCVTRNRSILEAIEYLAEAEDQEISLPEHTRLMNKYAR